MTVPKILYKYRSFSTRTMEQLCLDQIYFADPITFNDPLDTKPCVQSDCETELLVKTLYEMVRLRVHATMTAAAFSIRYRGPRTVDHIVKLSAAHAQQAIELAAYNANDPDYEISYDEAHRWLLTNEIERELLLQYGNGVVSLAKRYACPLMWSHYGDQHHGLCVGYRVPAAMNLSLKPVSYGGKRVVSARDVASMVLTKDPRARQRVDESVLFQKARDWKYEREWRLLGPRGPADSPMEMTEIVFGMRCSDSVKYSVACAFEEREGASPRFYEIRPVAGTFKLKRFEVDTDELRHTYPRRAFSAEGFTDVELAADELPAAASQVHAN